MTRPALHCAPSGNSSDGYSSDSRIKTSPSMSHEDDTPHKRNDTEPTIAAPPDSERKTNPPDPGEAARVDEFVEGALKARDRLSAETMRELAEHELVSLYRTAIGMHESLLGASGLLEQNRRSTVEDIAAVVDAGFERTWGRIEPRLSAQDKKIAGIRSEFEELKKRIEVIERRLDEDDDTAQGPAAPSAT